MEDNTTASAIIEESILMHHWEGENIENTLAALRPYLQHRQYIARHSHRIDFYELLPIYQHCNKEMLKILSMPKSLFTTKKYTK